MANQKAQPVSQPHKPRLKPVREVTLLMPLPIARGSAVYTANNSESITEDCDAQVIRIKLKPGGSFSIPFSQCKFWKPAAGVAKE